MRGDARVINDARKNNPITVEAFRGSAAVFNPLGEDVKGRKNEDYFANMKAQAWWGLRTRFQKTYQAVVEKKPINLDEIISIPSALPLRQKLVLELSQPTFSISAAGKILVDKAPDGTRSPNLADALMIRYARLQKAMVINPKVLAQV